MGEEANGNGRKENRRRPWVSRDINDFETCEQIGEGTYGEVWRAKDKATGEEVALKKVRMEQEREGFPLTAIREIKLLKMLRHENIVCLKEIVMGRDGETRKGKDSIYMVFEYMDHDLTGLLDTPGIRFSEPQVKCYMVQLLRGLAHCHARDVLHRDIKGSNLLINNKGMLKIADFGLARISADHGRRYTNKVITLWYRPPELLLGECEYGKSVDVWSCGCLLAELLLGRPLLKGNTEPEQLDLIFELFGCPTDENWPNWRRLPDAAMVREDKYRKTSSFRQAFASKISGLGIELIEKLLCLDPSKRLTTAEALNHEWFKTEPLACDPSQLPKYDSVHEYQAKLKKQEMRQNRQRHHRSEDDQARDRDRDRDRDRERDRDRDRDRDRGRERDYRHRHDVPVVRHYDHRRPSAEYYRSGDRREYSDGRYHVRDDGRDWGYSKRSRTGDDRDRRNREERGR